MARHSIPEANHCEHERYYLPMALYDDSGAGMAALSSSCNCCKQCQWPSVRRDLIILMSMLPLELRPTYLVEEVV